jgi:hypothetical protein
MMTYISQLTATMLSAGKLENEGSIHDMRRGTFVLHSIQTGSRAYLSSYQYNNGSKATMA